MYTISKELSDKMMDSDIRLEIESHFKDSVEKKMEYKDLLSMHYSSGAILGDSFAIGGIQASGFDFTLENMDNRWDKVRFGKKALKTSINYIKEDGTVESVPLCISNVESVEKNKKDETVVITSSDPMMRFNKRWNAKKGETKDGDGKDLIFKSGTVSDLERHICKCTKSGTTEETKECIKYAESNKPCNIMISEKAVKKFKGKNYRTLLSYCAELRAGYARINRIGELEMHQYDLGLEPTVKISYDQLLEYEVEDVPIKIKNISIVIKGEEFNMVTAHQAGDSKYNCVSIKLNGNNTIIANGVGDEGKMQMLRKIGEKIMDFTYLPGRIKCTANIAIDAGDMVAVEDEQGTWHNMLVGKIDLNDNLTMTITSPTAGNEDSDNFQGETSDALNDANNNSGLPDMAGCAGKVLTNDGSNAFWSFSGIQTAEISTVQLDGIMVDIQIADIKKVENEVSTNW